VLELQFDDAPLDGDDRGVRTVVGVQFRLRVQDDGKGFDEALLPRQAAARHYGVPGMRERAALMGGTLTVWSKEGAGTAVELCIPSRCAYVKTRERRWLSRAVAGE
jgi:signal transduction histidine kinase